MVTRLRGAAVLAGVILFLSAASEAATISYQVAQVAGSWQYSYSVTNGSLDAPLQEFTVFFDVARFRNLQVMGSPANWDSLVIQPDSGIPAPGYFDSLALTTPIAPGASLAGFAVRFDYLGTDTPGSLPFDVVNPITFARVSSGTTTAVPAPGALGLLGTGLLAVGWRPRRRADTRHPTP